MLDYLLLSSLALTSLSSCVLGYYLYKFSMIIIKIEDDIEDSLDELDESFSKMNEILDKPIFFDSVEVRQCISEIEKTRNIIIKVANRLTSFGDGVELTTSNINEEDNNDKREKEDA